MPLSTHALSESPGLIAPVLRATGAPSALAGRQEEFSSIIARASSGAATPAEKQRGAAEEFVAMTFIQPLLKSLRESSNAAAPFGAGPAERQFQSLMDAQIARRIVRAGHFPLVESVARRMQDANATRPDDAASPTR